MALEPIDEALAHCLELIDQDKLDIEACVEKYPQWKSELRELLRLALAIRSQAGQPVLPPDRIRHIRDRILHAPKQQPEADS